MKAPRTVHPRPVRPTTGVSRNDTGTRRRSPLPSSRSHRRFDRRHRQRADVPVPLFLHFLALISMKEIEGLPGCSGDMSSCDMHPGDLDGAHHRHTARPDAKQITGTNRGNEAKCDERKRLVGYLDAYGCGHWCSLERWIVASAFSHRRRSGTRRRRPRSHRDGRDPVTDRFFVVSFDFPRIPSFSVGCLRPPLGVFDGPSFCPYFFSFGRFTAEIAECYAHQAVVVAAIPLHEGTNG